MEAVVGFKRIAVGSGEVRWGTVRLGEAGPGWVGWGLEIVRMVDSCVFCQIVAGEAPATVLWRNDTSMVIVPLKPVVQGHVLAIPYQHAADFTESWHVTVAAMQATVHYAQGLDGDCNLITSKGPAATQSVYHLHIHIVPRRTNDGLALPWCSGKSHNH